MLDNALIELIITTLIAGEATAGISDTPIAQAFQPTDQGTPTEPTAFIYKIGDSRIGSRQAADNWDAVHETMVHTELQKYETTFQLSALYIQNPATPSQMTASDLCNLCISILQSSVAVGLFEDQEVGILRVGNVTNPPFINDKHRYEFNPSFDFTMTHNQIITSISPIIEVIVPQIIVI